MDRTQGRLPDRPLNPTTDDTKEKERLGKLWAARSNGACYFEMIKGPGELGKLQNAIAAASV